MSYRSVLITGAACYLTLFATCLGATSLAGGFSLPRSFVSDRKASVMVCNGALGVIRGVGAGWRHH
jgi:hypothetical protein